MLIPYKPIDKYTDDEKRKVLRESPEHHLSARGKYTPYDLGTKRTWERASYNYVIDCVLAGESTLHIAFMAGREYEDVFAVVKIIKYLFSQGGKREVS